MRKTLLGALLAVAAILSFAVPAGANVIPEDPKAGSQAFTRMRCYVGEVSFTITGNGVSIPVGTTIADADGWARLNFTVPDIAPGTYNMQARGQGCSGGEHVVNVTFVIRPKGGGQPPQYPPRGCKVGVDRYEARHGDRVKAMGFCFKGPVKFSFNGADVGSAPANADGTAEIEFSVPTVPTGDYLVAASGVSENDEPLVLSTSMLVLVPSGSGNPSVAVPPVASPGVVDVRIGAADVVIPGTAQPAVPTKVLGAVEEAPVVAAAQASRGGILAFTGSDTGAVVRLAAIVMLVGGVLTLAGRRRNARA